jgi:hypothetical protein
MKAYKAINMILEWWGVALLVALGIFFACVCLTGCFGATTVNVFSSRLVTAYGTNTVRQAIEGGANLSSNATTATIPLK